MPASTEDKHPADSQVSLKELQFLTRIGKRGSRNRSSAFRRFNTHVDSHLPTLLPRTTLLQNVRQREASHRGTGRGLARPRVAGWVWEGPGVATQVLCGGEQQRTHSCYH